MPTFAKFTFCDGQQQISIKCFSQLLWNDTTTSTDVEKGQIAGFVKAVFGQVRIADYFIWVYSSA